VQHHGHIHGGEPVHISEPVIHRCKQAGPTSGESLVLLLGKGGIAILEEWRFRFSYVHSSGALLSSKWDFAPVYPKKR
jgi:hypothetical protein